MPQRLRPDRRDEDGYILPMFALVLVVLLGFAALSVDVGSWYARASETQRAADAAALAGVVWMPDFTKARTAAIAAATRNGFTHGVDDATVSVTQVPGDTRRLQVAIADTQAPQFFSQVVLDDVAVGRSATAEYVLPVPMGSPKNTLGTGSNVFGGATENFWLAASGWCAAVENGDKRLPRHDRTWNGSSWTCPSFTGTNNPDYDADGYLYALSLAQAPGQQLTIQLYDAAYRQSGSNADQTYGSGTRNVTTIYTVYDTDDTPFDNSDNPVLHTRTVTTGDSSFPVNAWANLYTISNPEAGQYFLRVRTLANQASSQGSNGFGIRAKLGAGSTFNVCTTIAGNPGFLASCPQVHGVEEMSIYANASSTTADFFLAQVDSVHAGKKLKIDLFDPGEGATSIQILDPNGNTFPFTWATPCSPPTAPTGGCSGSSDGSNRLMVNNNGTQPYSDLSSQSKYNRRQMTLTLNLPNDYSVFSGKTWWKIRYVAGSSVTDRTTWAATIIGDPVHLVK
ncbi:MAG: pilus assembly protein TadG-related protein [Acidimicrobiia bacterium]